MRWQTDVRHSGSPQRSQANGINQQRMHIAARFALALEWQPSAAYTCMHVCMCMCVCVSVCLYSSVHLCRYKCICRLLWIANGIEEWERDKRTGRQIEWEIYCIHSLTHTHPYTFMHTFDELYKLMYGNYLDVYTDIPNPQLSRDRALAWQPFSLQLWQIVAAHTQYTHTHSDAGAWTRSSCRFLWAFIVLYKLLFFRNISPHYDDFQLTHSAGALSMKPFVGAAT